MTTLTRLGAITGLASALGLTLTAPAFAQHIDLTAMTCADPTAMAADDRFDAIEMLSMAAAEMAGEAMSADDTAMMAETTAAGLTACEATAAAPAMNELHAVQGDMHAGGSGATGLRRC